jgi:hypothetical protein
MMGSRGWWYCVFSPTSKGIKDPQKLVGMGGAYLNWSDVGFSGTYSEEEEDDDERDESSSEREASETAESEYSNSIGEADGCGR